MTCVLQLAAGEVQGSPPGCGEQVLGVPAGGKWYNLSTTLLQPCHNLVTTLLQLCHNLVRLPTTVLSHLTTIFLQLCYNLDTTLIYLF